MLLAAAFQSYVAFGGGGVVACLLCVCVRALGTYLKSFFSYLKSFFFGFCCACVVCVRESALGTDF